MSVLRTTFIIASLTASLLTGSAAYAASSPVTPSGSRIEPCPEVNDPPEYEVQKINGPGVLRATPPWSSTVEPGNSASFSRQGTYSTGSIVTAEVGLEVGAAFAKVNAKVGGSLTQHTSMTVTTTLTAKNSTNKRRTAHLSFLADRHRIIKTYYVAPCKLIEKRSVLLSPRPGNLSLLWED